MLARRVILAGPSLDPDARAYLAALSGVGISASVSQKRAIDAFIRGEKREGRWTSVKRFYLPIWGVAAANAVDVVTRASGTFSGGVTHGAGYIQGDGSTGYFSFAASPSDIGMGPANGHYLSLQAATTNQAGFVAHCGSGNTNRFSLYRGGQADLYTAFGGTTGHNGSTTDGGIASGQRFGGHTRIHKRLTAGRSTVVDTTVADAGATVTAPIYGLAWNFRDTAGSSPANYFNGQIGVLSAGLGMSDADDTAYTLAVKALWETCTGLTLP